MEPTPDLINDLFARKVRAARQMSSEQKLLAGPRLFDLACEFARAGIRLQNPNADEGAVQRELRRRLEIGRLLEKRHDER